MLEENREKGAYYTPKEIVHYMCQESLLLYLKNELLGKDAPMKGVIWSDSRSTDEQELEGFVRYKDRGKKDNFIYKNGRAIERALQKVRICDPAIGSGAFPMGLLYEIFHCHVELDLTQDYAQLKKDIIHHCIYGVDKDSGAVDIARLRFWLALVVDEQEPQPLPNLDFKIMQGDSLLESFEGIDLSKLLGGIKPKGQASLFGMLNEPTVEFNSKAKEKLSQWLDDFFEPQSTQQKSDLKEKIDSLIHRELNKAIESYKEKILDDLDEYQRKLKLEQSLKRPGLKFQKEITRLNAEKLASEAKQIQLAEWQERPERPFFLWHTWFREIFDRGGFDIVIGNPPYVQLQRLGFYTDKLQAAGYETFVRTGDLYCLFYEQALRLLRDGGVMAYITSNSWLKTIYGQPLRRYFVQHSTPVALLNFEDAQLFKAAIVETNILLALKGKHNVKTRAVALSKNTDMDIPLFELLFKNGDVIDNLSEKEWIIGNVEQAFLKSKMEQIGIQLGELPISINFGIKTGFNEAFIIDGEKMRELILKDPKNEEVIKPVIRGRDVQKYFYRESNLWIIISKYRDNENFVKNYPIVAEHLKTHESKLRQRGQVTNGQHHWIELDNNPTDKYFQKIETEKLIWGELSDRPKFAFDLNKLYPEATLFFMIGQRLKFILGILNSQIGEWYFNQISTTSGMGTNRWKKNKVEQLPIPPSTPEQEQKIERLVEYVLWANASLQENPGPEARQRADYLEQIINGLVYELYLPEQLQEAKLSIFEHLGMLPPLEKGHEADIIEAVFQRLFDKTHKVRNALFYLRIIPEVRLIMEGVNKQKYDPSLIKWEDDHEYVS
ncbi:MAG TPA: TaqI-like C-terminal specificity domain-containing protein [Haliscomenobacter sp.]|nr:TaqI-like C-terminal specificity domain-containing protein [Haliscomenobacter sp.]